MSHLMFKKPKIHVPRHPISHYVLAFMMVNMILGATSAFPSQSGEEPTGASTKERVLIALLVHIDQPLHFGQSDEQTVQVPSGVYLVEPLTQGESRLVLWHEHGTVTLQAVRTTHDQRVETPEAYLIREEGNEDIHHIVVFLPDGIALEATGSISRIQTRGNFRVTRHYQLDAVTGVVRFGDGQQGRRLPANQPNISSQYREGLSSQGEEMSLRLQMYMDRKSKAMQTISNVLKSLQGPFQLEAETDRPGNDYARHMENNAEACRTHCAGDENCQAFTFVKPNPGSAQGQCFLKRSEPQPVANPCCVSGTRSSREETIIQNMK